MRQQLRRSASRRWAAGYRRPAPLLIIHGARDATVPVTEGRTLAAARPDATFVEYPAAGHEVVWNPDARLRIAHWLAKL